jgi:hypothetical protein
MRLRFAIAGHAPKAEATPSAPETKPSAPETVARQETTNQETTNQETINSDTNSDETKIEAATGN